MSVCVNAGLLSEILILMRLGIWGIFLDLGGREHIIIWSSLMELSYERRKYVGVSQNSMFGFLLY
jgi:hypothetical protein